MMKSAFLISCAVLFLCPWANAGKVEPAPEYEILSIKVKAKLSYVDTNGENKRMGSTSAKFIVNTLHGQKALKIDGHAYPIAEGGIGTGGSHCNEMRYERSPRVKLTLDKPTLIQLMRAANGSIFRRASTERHVLGVIEKAVAAEKDELLNYYASYCGHSFIQDEDNRESTYEFTAPDTGEKVRLTLKIGRKFNVKEMGGRRGD